MTRVPRGRAVAVGAAALLGALAAWPLAPRDVPSAFPELDRGGRLPAAATATPEARGAAPGTEVRVRSASLSTHRWLATAQAPRRVAVPRLGLHLPVRPSGVDEDGLMALPDTAYAAAWYRYGSGPLTSRGATVIAGHVDTAAEGVGPWARLAGAAPGDLVTVAVRDRVVRYRVVTVQRIAKPTLDLARLFSRTGSPRLYLVTCGGDFRPERGGYQDNVVLAARRV